MVNGTNLGSTARAEKDQRFWLSSSIVSLLLGVGILAVFMYFIETPFEKKNPADHYYLIYIGISFVTVAIYCVTKFFRLDEKERKWYHAIINLMEVNMWLTIMTVLIVVIGFGLTYLYMLVHN